MKKSNLLTITSVIGGKQKFRIQIEGILEKTKIIYEGDDIMFLIKNQSTYEVLRIEAQNDILVLNVSELH